MSDQNVVKEGWVQKRGEDSPPPPTPSEAPPLFTLFCSDLLLRLVLCFC